MKKPVVLCVDDEATIRDSLRIELRKSLGRECSIETAASGEEALEIFAELMEEGYEVAVAIVDYTMPKMTGIELCKRIQEIAPKTLKIMLTGESDVRILMSGFKEAGLHRYLVKPWKSEFLQTLVANGLKAYFINLKMEQALKRSEKLRQSLQQYQKFNNKI
ncbi:response regulator [Candidatus Gracilibacteria bacterium]|jgi:response regulator RpfG family c-di-GMP phosphodiesterase|nr:response regulator [Candidatus Gracilibacteria bacterium]NJP20850.1 response regulator [Hydrococcus sp. CRU_1_1]